MSPCFQEPTFASLELPREFEDLEGLLRADLQAVVAMLTQRAHDRLWLTPREVQQLQQTLWNGLTEAVNAAVEPLSVECR